MRPGEILKAGGARSVSVSMRLALWYATSILVLLTAFASLSYVTFHRSLHGDFDQHLLHELRVLLPLVEFDEDGPGFSRFEAMRTVAYQTDGIFGTYVRLFDHDGVVRYRSPNLEGHAELEVSLPEEPFPTVKAIEWQDGPLRSHYHPLIEEEQLRGWLEVSGFEWSLHQELDRLAKTFGLGILLSVILALGGGYMLARRSLRPVAEITRVADEIRASHLDARIPIESSVQDELTGLANTINALLDRIQESFYRERRFSANAAHELVTPLAAVRGELELVLRGNTVSDELRPRLQAAVEDTDRMNGIIRSLLQLASAERLERREMQIRDVSEFVSDRLARFEDRATADGRTVRARLAPMCMARVDSESFGRVVDNLLDNALKYTEPGGTIEVRMGDAHGSVFLSVADDGVGFDPAVSEHLFDRFYRADSGAVRSRDGSGLGLAIVAAVMKAHEGTVSAGSRGPEKGARFEIRLPAA